MVRSTSQPARSGRGANRTSSQTHRLERMAGYGIIRAEEILAGYVEARGPGGES